jgi:hypothetical protein
MIHFDSMDRFWHRHFCLWLLFLWLLALGAVVAIQLAGGSPAVVYQAF